MNRDSLHVSNDGSDQRRAWATSTLRRLACALALIPIVPATAFVAATCCEEWFDSDPFDWIRWFNLFVAAGAVTASVLIWRTVILWTLGRTVLTALVGMIPFMQVLYAQPLWDAGCVSRDILRLGQEQVSLGVWVWVMIWVWWGGERWWLHARARTETGRRTLMPPGARRFVASLGTIPFVVGVFFIVWEVFDDLIDLPERFLAAATYATAAIAAIIAWVLIWRTGVAWNKRIIRWTLSSALLLLGGSIAATLLLPDLNGVAATTLWFLPVIGWGVWMAATMWLWPVRMAVDQTAPGPRCPRCDYPLTGLRHTRCPECGHEPTLDELWAATAEAAV